VDPQELLGHPAIAALSKRHGSNAEPEALVKSLCAELVDEAPDVPVDLDVLASFRNIRPPQVIEMPEAGSIHFDGTSYVVRLRASDSHRRRRFTLAHEIVHTFFSDGVADHADPEVGHYDRRDPEEYLCDIGAAELLFPPGPFRERCPERPSIEAIVELAGTFEGSIEATARRVVSLAAHDAHLVVLEPRLKPVQERALARQRLQPSLAGLEPDAPTPELRVKYAASNTDLFIPPHKSVDSSCTLAEVFERASVQYTGPTGLVAGREFRVTAKHLPLRGPAGEQIDRVIALLYAP
jgi:hypothetical protein